MEPITTTILSALAAGAIAAAKDTATKAVKDGYQALKKLIESRFAGKPGAALALAEHEKKPQVWKEPLADALTETGADKDEEIIRRANDLLKVLKQAGSGDSNVVSGSGAIATKGGVAAGEGGTAIGGNVYGDIGKRNE